MPPEALKLREEPGAMEAEDGEIEREAVGLLLVCGAETEAWALMVQERPEDSIQEASMVEAPSA